jgi:peptidyl-prolyl cis-trans isomerase SurA
MRVALLMMAACLLCRAEIIDRIAVVVGERVITESEIQREVRLTALLNGSAVDFSPASMRATAERLVEQRLIQSENDMSLYPQPAENSLEDALKQTQASFGSSEKYQAELKRAGVTEDELRAHLRRQLVTLRFLDLRFRPGVQIGEEEVADYFQRSLAPQLKKNHPNREFAPADFREQAEQALIADRVDKAADDWLKDARARTRIEFRAGVFGPGPAEQRRAEASK